MALCKKCGEREQHTFPNGRTVALCSVCGWNALVEILESPDVGGLTPRAADVARPLDAKGASMRDAFCNICKMYTSFSDQTSSYGLLVMGGVVTREKFKQKSPICSKCARRIKDKLTQK